MHAKAQGTTCSDAPALPRIKVLLCSCATCSVLRAPLRHPPTAADGQPAAGRGTGAGGGARLEAGTWSLLSGGNMPPRQPLA